MMQERAGNGRSKRVGPGAHESLDSSSSATEHMVHSQKAWRERVEVS